MVQFRVEAVVDPRKAQKGARDVRRELGRTETAAGALNRTLARVFTLTGIVLATRQLGRYADTYTGIQNRLRNVTDGQAELASTTAQLFQIANDTRQSFEGTAEVYARVGLAARDLGVEQDRLLRFTQSLNQAVALSGASGVEARAGLIQLSQGLASGTLRGDELNSVLEQLPVVADVIAKSLGVTRGELRALGQQGLITAGIVLDAFEEAREELDRRFGETVPTISQAFTVLDNRVLEFVGTTDQATGASANFAQGILTLADNIDFAIAGANVLVEILRELGPIIANDVQELAALGDELASQDAANRSFSETLATIADRTLGLLVGTGNAIRELFAGIGPAVADLLIESVNAVLRFLLSATDNVTAFFSTIGIQSQQVGNSVLNFFRELDAALGLLLKGEVDAAISFAETATETFGNQLNFAAANFGNTFEAELAKLQDSDFVPGLENEYAGAAAGLGQAVTDGFFEGLNVTLVRDTLDDIVQRADEARANAERARAAATAPGGGGGIEGEPGGAAGGVTSGVATLQQQAGLNLQKQLLEEIQGPQEQFLETQRALNELLDAGTISADEYAIALGKAAVAANTVSTSASQGLAAGLARINTELRDVSGAVENTVVNAFHAAEDAIVEFATTGEFNFSKFVDGILADVTRILAKQAILALIKAIAGDEGGGGGLGGVISGLFGGGKASGGFVNPGKTFLVGEEGPELFTPPEAGNIVPAGETAAALGGGKQQAPVVNVAPAAVTVVNSTDPDEITSAMEGAEGERVIMNVVSRNKEALGLS